MHVLPSLTVALKMLAQSGTPSSLLPWIIGGTITLVAGSIVLTVMAERRRKAALLQALADAGFTVSETDDQRAAGFSNIAHLPDLRGRSGGVRWHAAGPGSVEVVEHAYSVGSGKNRRTIVHTVASIPCPPTWPRLTLGPEGFFTRLGAMLGYKDLELDNPAFNARWRVKCEDETFALLALPPDLQQWLMTAARRESWHLGDGRICCLWDGVVKPAQVAAAAGRPAQWLALLPPELHAWRPVAQ